MIPHTVITNKMTVPLVCAGPADLLLLVKKTSVTLQLIFRRFHVYYHNLTSIHLLTEAWGYFHAN